MWASSISSQPLLLCWPTRNWSIVMNDCEFGCKIIFLVAKRDILQPLSDLSHPFIVKHHCVCLWVCTQSHRSEKAQYQIWKNTTASCLILEGKKRFTKATPTTNKSKPQHKQNQRQQEALQLRGTLVVELHTARNLRVAADAETYCVLSVGKQVCEKSACVVYDCVDGCVDDCVCECVDNSVDDCVFRLGEVCRAHKQQEMSIVENFLHLRILNMMKNSVSC